MRPGAVGAILSRLPPYTRPYTRGGDDDLRSINERYGTFTAKMVLPDGIEPHSLGSGVTARTTSQRRVSQQELENLVGIEPTYVGLQATT